MSATKTCLVLLKEDVQKVGLKGALVRVSKGYAENFILKKKLGSIIGEGEVKQLEKQNIKLEAKKLDLESTTSITAEKIKKLTVVIKEKIHDDNRLYGSIKEAQIVDALKDHGIVVGKSQINIKKSIKTLGEHIVSVKLNSKLVPDLNVKIVSL